MKKISILLIFLLVILFSGCDSQYTITFVDYDGRIIQTYDVKEGEDLTGVVYPEDPNREGYTFDGWSQDLPIAMTGFDFEIEAQYVINQYKLEIIGLNDEILYSEQYDYGYVLTDDDFPDELIIPEFNLLEWRRLAPETIPAEDSTITPDWIITIEEIKEYFLENGIEQEYRYNNNLYQGLYVIIESEDTPITFDIKVFMIQFDNYLGFVFSYLVPSQNVITFVDIIQDYDELFIKGDVVYVDITLDPFSIWDSIVTDFDLVSLDVSELNTTFAENITPLLMTSALEWFETTFSLDLD